jgi:hypothetical protein
MGDANVSFQVFMVVVIDQVIFGFLCHAVGKCYSVLEEHTASNFRVTELFQVYAKALWECVSYIERFEEVWAITGMEGRNEGFERYIFLQGETEVMWMVTVV